MAQDMWRHTIIYRNQLLEELKYMGLPTDETTDISVTELCFYILTTLLWNVSAVFVDFFKQ